jgi:hypothetical protein
MTAWRSLLSGLLLSSIFGLSAFACSGDDDDSSSTGTGGSGNTAGSDASSGGSGGSSTGGTSSGGTGGSSGSATGGSSGAATGGSAGAATGGSAGAAGAGGDAGGCEYFDIDILLVDCNAQHLYLRRWTSLSSDPNCPDYWTLEGQTQQFTSQGAALQSASCDEDCVRHPATSVSLLKCGVKTGYIVYHSDNCPDVLETPDGFFPSVAAWNAAVPCPDQ